MVGRDRSPRRSPSTTKAGRARRDRANRKTNVQRPTLNAQRSTHSPPIALSIAGSDSSAGAGIQADLKTFTALGVYGLTVVTCVVAEIPRKVSRIESLNPSMVCEQIKVLLENFQVGAIKTGLLCSEEIVSAVAQAIEDAKRETARPIPLVVDPVMIATSGDNLLGPGTIESYKTKLFPLATLITPNLDEAASFLATTIKNRKQMEDVAKNLAKEYRASILLKGGHLPDDNAIDLLFHHGKLIEFSAPFVRGVETHGTGCTYSAAITAGLACGFSLEEAIARAKTFVTQSIARHFRWKLGSTVIDALNHRFDCEEPPI